MELFFESDYWFARFLFQRALGLLYLIAFLNAVNQFRPLLGEQGLEPVPRFLKYVRFREAPSIFHFYYSDRFFGLIAWLGVILSTIAMLGFSDAGPLWFSMAIWFLLWLLYLSIVNVGQTFYSFGWESMLLETGFLAIFLGSSSVAAPLIGIFLIRWVLFRVEFGAGLIKLRGDNCWRDLTCLYYHHETQPMPNPLSWYFHRLPQSLHKGEVLFNHFVQLIVPWGLFFPQPIAAIAGTLIIISQLWLVLSGNFSWLNFLTIILALASFSDTTLASIVPLTIPFPLSPPLFYALIVEGLALFVIILSVRPIQNMFSPYQLMNYSFEPFHFVNTYGAFGSITKKRYEIIIEGTDENQITPITRWREYEFKGKPGNPARRPRQVAPYHLRLDWLMWFAAMSSYHFHPWFLALIKKLLQSDQQTLKLLAKNPFPDKTPTFIRARLYHYRFTTWQERHATGNWWFPTLVGEYSPPISLENLNTQAL